MRKLKLEELGRLTEAEFKSVDKIPLVVVLDNIRSGHNVGSVFRTSDAFAIERIILTGYTPQPPHKEIHKTAIGATSSMNWEYEKDVVVAVSKLKVDNYQILGIEQTDQSVLLEQVDVQENDKIAIVLGNEVTGLSDQLLPLLDAAVEINQYGTKHSLNVSVCAGIVIHHLTEQFRAV